MLSIFNWCENASLELYTIGVVMDVVVFFFSCGSGLISQVEGQSFDFVRKLR